MVIIKTHNLTKKFKDLLAVDDVDLEVEKGECFGLLGPNEAHRRSMEVLSLFELENKRNNHIRELSGGMKRRLLLARGLINMPKILVLDEPTIGLDPQGKYLVWHNPEISSG